MELHHFTKESKSRRTGTLVTLVHADDAQLDPEGGSWYTICEHGALVNHTSLKVAKNWMPEPDMWCEDCRDAMEAKNPK